MPLIFWETQRLILRSFVVDDLQLFCDYRSDPKIAQYQSWNTPCTLDQAKKFFSEMNDLQPGIPGEWYQIAFERKNVPGIIGDCAFQVFQNDSQQAEIGFTIAREFQNLGYATEAITGLLDYLFSNLNLHRIIAICDIDNRPSVQLLEKLGMRREGYFIENTWFKGTWSNEFLYAILEREWGQKK